MSADDVRVTAGQRYAQWVNVNPASQDAQTRYMVDAYRKENQHLRAELAQLRRDGCYPMPSAEWAGSITCGRCGVSWATGSHLPPTSGPHICPGSLDFDGVSGGDGG